MLCFWGLWYFLNLLPSSVIPLNDFMAEHRVYISMFGFSACLGYLLVLFTSRSGKPSYLIMGVLIFQVAFYTGATLRRNKIWQNEIALWTDSVEKSPSKMRPHINLGAALLRDAYVDRAMYQYLYALALNPRFAAGYNGMGFCLLNKGRLVSAEKNFRMAVSIDPELVDPKTGLGIVYYQQGKCAEALPNFEQVYPERQESADLLRMMATCYAGTGNLAMAREFQERGKKLDPGNRFWEVDLKQLLRQKKGAE